MGTTHSTCNEFSLEGDDEPLSLPRLHGLWSLLKSVLFVKPDDPPGLTEDLLEVLFEDDGSHYETTRIDGVVTRLYEAHNLAVINKDVYMDLSVPTPGGRRVRLGDFVLATVRRRRVEDAWCVERVEVLDRAAKPPDNCFDTPSLEEALSCNSPSAAGLMSHLKSKTVVGQVTSITGRRVVINHGEADFEPTTVDISYAVGDWLSLKVLFDPEEMQQKGKCIGAGPLRKWKLEGRVNLLEGVAGVIENDIYFTTSACMTGYTPRLKDLVHVTAIESNAGGAEFTWRAVSVAPSSNFVRLNCGSGHPTSAPSTATRPHLGDTGGVCVERRCNFGAVEVNSANELRIEVTNSSAEERVLKDANFVSRLSDFDVRGPSLPVVVPAGGRIYIDVLFRASSMGKNEDFLELDFGKFIIERLVSADVVGKTVDAGKTDADSFIERFRQRQLISRRQVMEDESCRHSNWVLKGVQPFKPPAFTSLRLGSYTVPQSLWETLNQQRDIVSANPALGEPLGPKNYVAKFRTLLHLEEMETTVRLRMYDMKRASLKPIGPYLALEVAGLAEKRPSLVPGDTVILSNPWGDGRLCYEGFVHKTLKSEALIQFHPNFHDTYDGEDYAVRFQFSRTGLRRLHAAVEASAKHPGYKFLFPGSDALETRPPQVNQAPSDLLADSTPEPEWINLFLNEEQRRAVMHILDGAYRPVPYIIYGPPGTGKTVTVVEAVLQVFVRCPRSRILVATPSNSSADLIAHRLHQSDRIRPGDMVRLNAFSRNAGSMPEEIQPYVMSCEDVQQAVRHRIVISTCTTAGTIYTLGLQHGHFTHLFVDEAGQATEPETLVAIGLMRVDSDPGQIILAGDPKQLGPVLMSQYSSAYGLSLSLLERLSLNPLYARNEALATTGHYDPKLLTKLVRNYRSHPSLLALPSYMFYDSELIPCASAKVAQKLAHFDWLPAPGTPLLFHGIRGENLQEPDSPSWCNPAEVYHVVRYLQLLLNANIKPDDVGVITPYRKQVEKIRDFINANDLCSFKVGSVEEFQGQERDVVIISTVRSSESFVGEDVAQHLGFLRSPKRFNVTVTRAKSLLIVIGNPHLLAYDEHWGPFLRHCVQLGAYTGCDLPQW